MRTLEIDAQFHNLLPPLTTEERAALRDSIAAEGCREPLIVWDRSQKALLCAGLGVCKGDSCKYDHKQVPLSRWEPGDGIWMCPECGYGIAPMEEDVLVDGHNRYEICRELGKPFKIVKRQFADADAVMDWIDANQIARRNLTPDAFRLALGRRYNRVKKTYAEAGALKSRGQVDPGRTAARLATEHGVSEATVKRAAKFAKEVEANPELQEAIRHRKPISKIKKEKNRQVRRDRIISESKRTAGERAVIRHGDCMKALEDVKTIDLLLTDPPYFTDGDFTAQVSAFLARVKQTGQAYVFASADPNEIAAYLAMDRHRMTLEQVLVWNYNNTGQRQPSTRYNSNFQVVFYFRGKKAHPINKPSDGTHQYACQTVNAPDGRIGDRFHEWQKPIGLIERYILNSSTEGSVVCDPFAGTGTTLLAAAMHGRKAIGCDVDKSAIKIAIERGCVSR